MLTQELPLVTFISQAKDPRREDAVAAVDTFDPWQGLGKRDPALRFNDYNLNRTFEIHASCDGLIILTLSDRRFYICNPATKQWIILSSLKGVHIGGLYWHPSSNEYRVLFYRPNHWRFYNYHILNVDPSESERDIGQPADSAASKEVIKYGLQDNNPHPSVLLHNCLHWKKKEHVIVFDIMKESFSCMPSPTHDLAAHLLQVDGHLGMGHVDGDGSAKLWVLQDYEEHENRHWSLRHNIKLQVEEIRSTFHGKELKGIFISEDGDVFVSCSKARHLFHCDKEGKVVNKFQWDEYAKLTGHWFKKNTVQHAFLDVEHQATPRFFLGFNDASR